MPINYSTMRSDVKRFQATGREPVMNDVVYNIDSAHKQGLSTVRSPSPFQFEFGLRAALLGVFFGWARLRSRRR